MKSWFQRDDRNDYSPDDDDVYDDAFDDDYDLAATIPDAPAFNADDPTATPSDAWLLDVQLPPPPAQTMPAPELPPQAYLAPQFVRAPSLRPTLLELRDVTVTYGQIAAVRNLSLTVGAGELVALLGANGAGKTTTLRAISGLHRPRAGQIYFDGKRIDRLGAERIARMGIAHLPEGRGMFPHLSVSENFRMAAYGSGVPMAQYGARLDSALQLFPVLRERMGQLAGTLSGGQQQMLAVARALVTRPRLLMIDELSFGLAPVVVKQLFALLPHILTEGTSILLVEQFVGQALAVASQAYVLEKGELTYVGPADSLAEREGFVESSYLGSGAQRPNYQRTRPAETEMLRVRVEPAMVRRLRLAADGRTLHQMTNEALRRYLSTVETSNTPTTGAAYPTTASADAGDQKGGAN